MSTKSHVTVFNHETGQTHSMNLSNASAKLLVSIAIKFALIDEQECIK